MGNKAKAIYLVFFWCLWFLYDYIIFFVHSERLDALLKATDYRGTSGMDVALVIMGFSGLILLIGMIVTVFDDSTDKEQVDSKAKETAADDPHY